MTWKSIFNVWRHICAHSLTDPQLEHEVSASIAIYFLNFLMIFATVPWHLVHQSIHKVKMHRFRQLSFHILVYLGVNFVKMWILTVRPFVHLGAQRLAQYSTAGLAQPGFNECFIIASAFFTSFLQVSMTLNLETTWNIKYRNWR